MRKQFIFISILLVFILVLSSCSSGNTVDEELESKIQEAETKITTLETNISSLENNLDNLETTIEEKNSLIEEKDNTISELYNEIETLSNPPSQSASLVNEAFTVLGHLANEDGAALANHANPTKGVRFSPYFNVNTNTDIVFYPGNTIGLNMFTNTTVYVWGEFDVFGKIKTKQYGS